MRPTNKPHDHIATMPLGKNLKTLREARGLTQQQLTLSTGLTVGYISKLEGDRADPSASTLRKLAQALGTTSDALLFDEGERQPGDDLKQLFELASGLPETKREMVKEFILTVVQRHQNQALLKDE